MAKTKIEWTHGVRDDGSIIPGYSFNPWWGCVKVSPGCVNCYALAFSKRTGHDIWGVDKPRRFFGDTHWNEPVRWNAEAFSMKERRRVFCASMADVFEIHKSDNDMLDAEREKLSDLIKHTPHLDWLLLTKRIEAAGHYLERMFEEVPPNLWLGATCETQATLDFRLPLLMETKWRLNINTVFISVEPQLEKISLYPRGIENGFPDWVIVGGESGANCRPFDPDWARALRDETHEAGVAFFMKQLGGPTGNKRARIEDLPEDLRIREYPSGL